MTRAMNTLIITRAHYRRRYGSDAPEMSLPSRFLEEIPTQLIENLGGSSPIQPWSTPGYPKTFGNKYAKPGQGNDFDRHYNYEDESQEAHAAGEKRSAPTSKSLAGTVQRGFGTGIKHDPSKPFVGSWMKPKAAAPSASSSSAAPTKVGDAGSIDNIARFFGGKAGAQPQRVPATLGPGNTPPAETRAAVLGKGQRVRHSKYGEGTILMREGDGEDAKLTVMFSRHGMKKMMEKFANLQKI
jgi:DNA helicase-2/ATP-dependent DNA helicase PcrA